MPSEHLLASDHGFRIFQADQDLVFERPAGATSPLSAWIPLGISFLGILVGTSLIAQSFSDAEARADLRTGSVLLFLLSGLAFALGRRAYRRLRIEQEQAGVRLRLDATALRNDRGEQLAARDGLRIRTRIDLTDGMGGFRWARVLYLCWPQGDVPIFRSYDKAQVQKLASDLGRLGLPDAAA